METNQLQLLSVKEASHIFKMSTYAIYSLIKTDPTFPCLNIGPKKNYRIPSDLLKSWLEQRFKERQYAGLNVPTADQLLKIGRN